jgi:hypothetical protein
MKRGAPTVLVVEDVLSEGVLRKVLRHFDSKFSVVSCLGREGYGFIKKNLPAFNEASAQACFVVMTDLDDNGCAPSLRKLWHNQPFHHNLLFRVAIIEVEAWLLANRRSFARYLGVPRDRIPVDSQGIRHPKEFIIDLARRSRRPEIISAIVPRSSRRSRVGPDYNGCLLRFVDRHWNFEAARKNSDSLDRALKAFEAYAPRL